MTKIVLIPGFGTHISTPLYNSPASDCYDFWVFKDLIEKKEAVFFDWGADPVRLNWWEIMYPPSYTKVYKKESRLVDQETLQEQLHDFLTIHQPETVVVFSMGGRLLLNTMEKFGIGDSIKQVIFVQADYSRNRDINNKTVLERVQQGTLHFYNFHCFWDTSLLTSAIMNRYLPAGLVGSRIRFIKNHFFPLNKRIQVHISTISDKKFLQKLRNLP